MRRVCFQGLYVIHERYRDRAIYQAVGQYLLRSLVLSTLKLELGSLPQAQRLLLLLLLAPQMLRPTPLRLLIFLAFPALCLKPLHLRPHILVNCHINGLPSPTQSRPVLN
jgi:hypothetical protein